MGSLPTGNGLAIILTAVMVVSAVGIVLAVTSLWYSARALRALRKYIKGLESDHDAEFTDIAEILERYGML